MHFLSIASVALGYLTVTSVASPSPNAKLQPRATSECKYVQGATYNYDIVIDTVQDGGLCGGFFANLNFNGACPVRHYISLETYYQLTLCLQFSENVCTTNGSVKTIRFTAGGMYPGVFDYQLYAH
jgi:hypothetical protein